MSVVILGKVFTDNELKLIQEQEHVTHEFWRSYMYTFYPRSIIVK